MDDAPADETRFTDREVREILQRAVAPVPKGGGASGGGHSLAELRAIAGEVGIDPQRIEAAARSVALERHGRSGALTGAPRLIALERTVEGTLDPADTPKALAVIRRRMGQKGEVQEIHGSLEWSVTDEFVDRHVTMTPAADGTTISATSNLLNATIVTYMAGGVIGSVLLFALLGDIGLFLIPVLLVVLRFTLKGIAGREAEKLAALVDDLTRFVGEDEDAPA